MNSYVNDRKTCFIQIIGSIYRCIISTPVLFASLEEKRAESLGKKEEQVKETKDIGRGGFWEGHFSSQ